MTISLAAPKTEVNAPKLADVVFDETPNSSVLEERIKGRVLKQIPIHLSVAVAREIRDSMTIDELAPQIGDMFIYQLSAMSTGAEVEVARAEFPASGWDWFKAALFKYAPDWLARRIPVNVIEVPTKVSYHFGTVSN